MTTQYERYSLGSVIFLTRFYVYDVRRRICNNILIVELNKSWVCIIIDIGRLLP